MNGTLTSVRLVNRALVKEGPVHEPLFYYNEIIKKTEQYNLAVRGSTYGAYVPGPYVEAIYPKEHENSYPIDMFIQYLKSISSCFDYYKGLKPYTILEFSISFLLSENDEIIKGKTQFVIWYDSLKEDLKYSSTDIKEEPILSVKPNLQKRITRDELDLALSTKNIFINK